MPNLWIWSVSAFASHSGQWWGLSQRGFLQHYMGTRCLALRLFCCQHRCQGSLCLVWSFKFLFFCGVETQADLQQTTLKTFQTVALSCATNSWRSWYLCGLQRSEVDFPMSVLMKIISRLNEYQADRYSVAANRQYGKCLGTSTARIAHKLKHWTG